MSEISKSMMISATGLKAQATRLRVISENIANAQSTGASPDEAPYRRKMVTFEAVRGGLGRDGQGVRVDQVMPDNSAFGRRYEPSHPAADADGYIKTPNVNTLIEVMDMREAQRSYEANLRSIELSRDMLLRTIDMLRGQ